MTADPDVPELVPAHIDLPIPAEEIGGLGTAAVRDVGEGFDDVVMGGDARIAPPKFFEGINLYVYGHSYAAAYGTMASSGGASSIDSLFPYRVARRLRMHGPYVRIVPATVAAYTQMIVTQGGAAQWDWQPLIRDSTGGRDRGMVILDCVTNDTLFRTASAADILAFKDTLRTSLRYLNRSNSYITPEAEGMPTTGSWGQLNEPAWAFSVPPDQWHLHARHALTVQGDTQVVSTIWPRENGRKLAVSAPRWNQGIVAGAFNVYDGTFGVGSTPLKGTFNNGGGYTTSYSISGGQPTSGNPDANPNASETRNWEFFNATQVFDLDTFTTVGGDSAIISFRNPVQGLRIWIDCVWGLCNRTGNDFPPYVYVIQDGYNPGWDPTPGGARYAAFNNAVAQVCAEPEFVEYAFAVDVAAAGWDHTTMLHASAHPNDAGHECYATAIVDRMVETLTGYTEGPHITV